jgi:hypothetical protein
VPQSQQ